MNDNLCLGCMQEIYSDAACPRCGFDANITANKPPFLPLDTKLQNRFIVGKNLENNGEGVTYIGYDTKYDLIVRIREYLPEGLGERASDGISVNIADGSELQFNESIVAFLELARALARMRELDALLPVYVIFEENGTAYYVSEMIESITLREFLLRNAGALTWEQACPLFAPVLVGLHTLSTVDVIHRGISPETLIVGEDGKMRITGFCIANARTARTDIVSQLYPGYAAIEQYGFEGQQGPCTDVYGVAATLFRTLCGNPPPEATVRITNDRMMIPASVAQNIPDNVLTSLANALQILPEDRTENCQYFKEELLITDEHLNSNLIKSNNTLNEVKAKPRVPSYNNKEIEDPKQNNTQNKNNKSIKYVAVMFIGTLLIIGGVFAFSFFVIGNNNDPYGGLSSSSATTSSAVSSAVSSSAPSAALVNPQPVPDLAGKSYSDLLADKTVTDNFTVEVDENGFAYSDAVEKGGIIEQTPAPGTKVEKGSPIRIKLSLGPSSVAVPDVRGKTVEQAQIAILSMGFLPDNITIVEKYDDAALPDAVLGTTPTAGTKVPVYSKITIIVNSYEKPSEPPPPPPSSSVPPSSDQQSSSSPNSLPVYEPQSVQ